MSKKLIIAFSIAWLFVVAMWLWKQEQSQKTKKKQAASKSLQKKSQSLPQKFQKTKIQKVKRVHSSLSRSLFPSRYRTFEQTIPKHLPRKLRQLLQALGKGVDEGVLLGSLSALQRFEKDFGGDVSYLWVGLLRSRKKVVFEFAQKELVKAGMDSVLALKWGLGCKDRRIEKQSLLLLFLLRPGKKLASALPALLELLGRGEQKIPHLLSEIGASVIPLLIPALESKNARIRWGVAMTFSFLGPQAIRAIPALLKRVTDSEGSVRIAALEALEQIRLGTPQIYRTIRILFDDPEKKIREKSLLVLKKLGISEAKLFVDWGRQTQRRLGCLYCHKDRVTQKTGPSFLEMSGEWVLLKNGKTVRRSEAYLKRALFEPNKEIVFGFKPLMPIYKQRLSPLELRGIISYIRSFRSRPHAWHKKVSQKTVQPSSKPTSLQVKPKRPSSIPTSLQANPKN